MTVHALMPSMFSRFSGKWMVRAAAGGAVLSALSWTAPAPAQITVSARRSPNAEAAYQSAARGRCEDAVGLFSAAIEHEPFVFEYLRDRGACYERVGSFSGVTAMPTTAVGYRYQRPNGGFIFRADVTPSLVFGERTYLMLSGGLSFGYGF